jgi:hypothetical protein
MVTTILTHEVKDYDVWRKAFDGDETNRSNAGFKTHGVYRGVENPNSITIMMDAPSMEAINAFMTNPDLKAAMEKGGVISAPEVKILNKV